ncbi:MAG TPA: hypothetical protein VHZ77_09900 [Gaiellaceae bacterium]|nr:hypothetical protein [Gaiellaceae bacterium]
MPTRKQRRRAQKERRHDYEYETVWVDPDTGEEVEPPEDYVPEPPETRENGKPSPKPKAKAQPQRGGRPVRVPPPPSWQRAAKRSVIIGAALFAVIYLLGSKGGNHSLASAFLLALVYTAIFIPAQFMLDRFAHNRWQRRADEQAGKRPAKRR